MSQLKVMISSTARDLPDHRKEVMAACLRQGMFPTMMEHLPAADADAIAESLRMVVEANIYLGVFAHRYGPPFAYHWGRKAASAHLNALSAPEPSDLPPYDESKHEPMPDVEIDPPDLPVEAPEE
jgi:hypothetical protein